MRRLIFQIVTCIISIFKVYALTPLETDSVNVCEILSKMPQETRECDKIIFGKNGFYYLVIVNDSVQTQYFAHPDSTISHLEVDRILSGYDKVYNPDLSCYFKAKDNLIDGVSQELNSQSSTIGYPVYIAYVENELIKSHMSFQAFTNYPVPFSLFFYLAKYTGCLIHNKYSDIDYSISRRGYKWNSQIE